jgi:hypothetical protein
MGGLRAGGGGAIRFHLDLISEVLRLHFASFRVFVHLTSISCRLHFASHVGVTSMSLRCQFEFRKCGFGKVRYTGALGEHTTTDATIKKLNRNDNNAKDNKRERLDLLMAELEERKLAKKKAKVGAESMAAVHAQASEEIKAAREKIDEAKATQFMIEDAKEPYTQTLISDFWLGIDQSLLNNQTMNR